MRTFILWVVLLFSSNLLAETTIFSDQSSSPPLSALPAAKPTKAPPPPSEIQQPPAIQQPTVAPVSQTIDTSASDLPAPDSTTELREAVDRLIFCSPGSSLIHLTKSEAKITLTYEVMGWQEEKCTIKVTASMPSKSPIAEIDVCRFDQSTLSSIDLSQSNFSDNERYEKEQLMKILSISKLLGCQVVQSAKQTQNNLSTQ